jgi:hypothetical protein
MRIGIDVDDTIYDFDGTARSVLYVHDTDPQGSRLPEPLTEAQRADLINGVNYDQWDGIEKIVGVKDWDWLWQNANETNLFQRGLPLPGALGALRMLAAEHEVWLMTARDQKWSHQTYSWLYRFGLDAASVVHGKSKWEVAADLDFRVVVDDGPKNLKGYLKRLSSSMKGAFIYGIKRYEPVESTYARFRYVESLLDVVDDHERWEA